MLASDRPHFLNHNFAPSASSTYAVDGESVERIEELVLAAQELPSISETLRELANYASANRVHTVAMTDDQVSSVRAALRCIICQGQ